MILKVENTKSGDISEIFTSDFEPIFQSNWGEGGNRGVCQGGGIYPLGGGARAKKEG